jgi:hypothetical protein
MLPIIKPSTSFRDQQSKKGAESRPSHPSDTTKMDDNMDLKFATFTSEIELPFYSNLFSSKLEHDKLDDSMRPVLGLYEPRVGVDPASSTKMQIRGNALAYST